MPQYDTQKLMQYYEQMLLIRRFEERSGQLYGMGLIGGFCHLYIGQEAVVVGIQDALKPQDAVITAYRDHGHMLVCGMDPNGVMAELTGRAGGYSRGKGGSMHMFSREKNFFGGHGIVGGQVPIGTGIAFGQKYLGQDAICVTYMGDGAANQGQVYESFNMAALWGLPVLYVVENNRYSMGTAVERHSASKTFHKRGEPWGIPGKQVNGMDVLAVHAAAAEAVDYVRTHQKPMLLDVETYRYRGHSMSDPAKYRSKEEVDDVRDHQDPIDHVHALLTKECGVTEDALKTIDKAIIERVKEAVEFSKTSPEPDLSELYTDVIIEA